VTVLAFAEVLLPSTLLFAAVVAAVHALADPFLAWAARRRRRAEDIRVSLHLEKPLPLSTFGGPAIFAGAVAVGVVVGGSALLPAAFVGFLASRVVDHWPDVLRKRRMRKFEQQLPDGMVSLSNALRAGLALAPAIEEVVKDSRPPLSQEFDRIHQEHKHGTSIEQAFENARRRLKHPEFDLCVAAFRVGRTQGGDVTQVFEQIASALREIRRLEEHIRTVSTQGRSSARFMTIMPGVFLVLLYVMDPEAVRLLFTDPIGTAILCVVIGLNVVGHLWIRRILSVRI
jgi:tight adherence protein B